MSQLVATKVSRFHQSLNRPLKVGQHLHLLSGSAQYRHATSAANVKPRCVIESSPSIVSETRVSVLESIQCARDARLEDLSANTRLESRVLVVLRKPGFAMLSLLQTYDPLPIRVFTHMALNIHNNSGVIILKIMRHCPIIVPFAVCRPFLPHSVRMSPLNFP